MGKRNRRRKGEVPGAPTSEYADDEGNVLTLRGAMSPATRREYASILDRSSAAASQEDAWHRSVEFLFERLATRWEIAGLPIERDRELLARFRVATVAERAFVRDALRRHLAEHFPELRSP